MEKFEIENCTQTAPDRSDCLHKSKFYSNQKTSVRREMVKKHRMEKKMD